MNRTAAFLQIKTVGLISAALATAALLFAASNAYAWTASSNGSTLTVNASAGEANKFSIGDAGFNFLVTDNNGNAFSGLLPEGCLNLLENRISCESLGIVTIAVYAGDLGDQISDASSVLVMQQYGGPGNDLLSGGNGTDQLVGDAGNDQLSGGVDDDTLDGGDGIDTLSGGPGNDQIQGGAGSDLIDGAQGNDTIDGNDGADVIEGDDDNDVISGGNGNDTIEGGYGVDDLNGDGGDDSLNAGEGNDTIDGGDGQDELLGGIGNDTLSGGDGIDLLTGGIGADSLIGGAQSDTLYGGSGPDSLIGGGGNDTLTGSEGNDTLEGGSGSDQIDAGNGNDTLTGDAGDDSLFGQDGNDSLSGGDGNDTLEPGAGADTVQGGAGTHDAVSYAGETTPVSLSLDGIANDGAVGESDNLGAGIEDLIGGAGADILAGNDGANILDGRGGNDILTGGGGNDRLDGGEADDLLDGGGGADTLRGQGGTDTANYALRNQPVNVSLDGAANDGQAGEGDLVDTENVRGGSAGDTLRDSPSESNTFEGGPGNDQFFARGFTGGAADTISCGSGYDSADLDSVDNYDSTCESVFADGVRVFPVPAESLAIRSRPVPRPALRFVKRNLKISSKKVRLRVICKPETDGFCKARIAITMKIKRRKTVLALKNLKIKTGKTRRFSFRLRKKDYSRLKRARKKGLRLRVDITLQDKAGRTRIQRTKLKLRYKRARRGKAGGRKPKVR